MSRATNSLQIVQSIAKYSAPELERDERLNLDVHIDEAEDDYVLVAKYWRVDERGDMKRTTYRYAVVPIPGRTVVMALDAGHKSVVVGEVYGAVKRAVALVKPPPTPPFRIGKRHPRRLQPKRAA